MYCTCTAYTVTHRACRTYSQCSESIIIVCVKYLGPGMQTCGYGGVSMKYADVRYVTRTINTMGRQHSVGNNRCLLTILLGVCPIKNGGFKMGLNNCETVLSLDSLGIRTFHNSAA